MRRSTPPRDDLYSIYLRMPYNNVAILAQAHLIKLRRFLAQAFGVGADSSCHGQQRFAA